MVYLLCYTSNSLLQGVDHRYLLPSRGEVLHPQGIGYCILQGKLSVHNDWNLKNMIHWYFIRKHIPNIF